MTKCDQKMPEILIVVALIVNGCREKENYISSFFIVVSSVGNATHIIVLLMPEKLTKKVALTSKAHCANGKMITRRNGRVREHTKGSCRTKRATRGGGKKKIRDDDRRLPLPSSSSFSSSVATNPLLLLFLAFPFP